MKDDVKKYLGLKTKEDVIKYLEDCLLDFEPYFYEDIEDDMKIKKCNHKWHIIDDYMGFLWGPKCEITEGRVECKKCFKTKSGGIHRSIPNKQLSDYKKKRSKELKKLNNLYKNN